MVQFGEALSDIELRRQQIASWIEDAVKPVEHALKDEANADELAVVGFTDSKTGAVKPEFEVREYQLDAWGAIWDARQTGADRGLIHLATGLGKTSVGVFDAMKFREEFRAQHGRDPKILFTVHQKDILDQAAERFSAFMPDASIGFYNGIKKDLSGDITFASLQSLHANLDQLDSKAFDYIINDEVHHAKARTYEKVVDHFEPQFRLGLTATPNRADEKDIRELYGTELYTKGLPEALAEGWLASPDYHIVFDDAVKQAMQSGFEANSLRALAELFNVQPRNDVIAENIKEEMEKIGLEFGTVKTIVFCQNIEHAEEMAELLGGKAYHSQDKDPGTFDAFKKGDLQVITTRDMFNEGVDVPDARLLVFLRSTSSQTIFEQQLGRGLRKTEGKDSVSVLDFVANVERISLIQELANAIRKSGTGNNGRGTNEDGGPEGPIVCGPDENLIISTNYADFDFDKLTVDILQKYGDIVSMPAPEGHLSLSRFAEELSIAQKTLQKLIEENDIPVDKHRFGNTIGTSFSPDNQIIVRHILGDRAPEIPDDYVSVASFARDNNKGAETVFKLIAEHGIETRLFKVGSNPAEAIDVETQEFLLSLPDFAVLKAPEGYKSVNTLAAEMGISKRSLDAAIEEEGLKLGVFIFGARGAIKGRGLSPEQQTHLEIKLSSIPNNSSAMPAIAMLAPEGYVNLHQFTTANRTSRGTVEKLLEEAGLGLEVHRYGRRVTTGLSPRAQAILLSSTELSQGLKEGSMSINAFAKSFGMTPETIKKFIKEHDLPTESYFVGGKVLPTALGIETQDKLRDILGGEIQSAPEDYLNLKQFGAQVGMSPSGLQNLMQKYDLTAGEFKFKGITAIGLSPELQQQIKSLPELITPVAPEGYLSISAFSKQIKKGDKSVLKAISEHGLETTSHKFGTKIATSLSPELQTEIKRLLDL